MISRELTSKVNQWLEIITRKDIIKRSINISLCVGTVLALLNHGDKLLINQITSSDVCKIIITYFVPFSVSTYSSLQNELNNQSKM